LLKPPPGNLTFVGSTGILGGVTEETARPLGEWLRQRREELGISLEQAEADTRIRARYLKALEAEDLDALPDPIVGRGFLRNYASYLRLDAEEAVARFAQFGAPALSQPLPAEDERPFGSEPFRPVALHDMPGFRSRRGWIVGLVAILLVALALAAWWGAPHLVALWNWAMPAARATATNEIASTTAPTATRTAPRAIETLAPTGTLTEATPAEATVTLQPMLTATLTPSPSATPSRPVYLGIFLELVLTDTSWIQVSVDGVRQFQGELEGGTYRSWYGEERIELRIGNAGAVLITINGQSLGTLGPVGDVVDRVFEKVGEGVVEATVTAGPTGTVTVTPGPTGTQPPAAGTETPSPEISPSATLTPTVPLTATAGP
jgi:cytoskeletal protein RodZ